MKEKMPVFPQVKLLNITQKPTRVIITRTFIFNNIRTFFESSKYINQRRASSAKHETN